MSSHWTASRPLKEEEASCTGLIETRFGLDPGTADKLIAAATLVEGEAVDLYHFTSVIMRAVDEAGRIRIVEDDVGARLRQMARVSEFERGMSSGEPPICSACRRGDRIELKRPGGAGGAAATSDAAGLNGRGLTWRLTWPKTIALDPFT